MPSPITDENDAMDALRLMCPPTVAPTLDETNELLPILRGCVRAAVWVASTAYYTGDVVIPLTRNGHRFECVASGTSGSDEPSWDNSRVSDGDAVWQESGREFDLWNLREAARQGWRLKRSKTTPCVNIRVGDISKSRSDIYTHCKEMEMSFAPIVIA